MVWKGTTGLLVKSTAHNGMKGTRAATYNVESRPFQNIMNPVTRRDPTTFDSDVCVQVSGVMCTQRWTTPPRLVI